MIGAVYVQFASSKIYEESTNHLTEIYNQANSSIHELVSRNWKQLQSWVPFLSKMEDEDTIASYVQAQQDLWGFTDFYFISESGNIQTTTGETGYLELRGQLPKLILDHECIVADTTMPNSSELIVFAVPAVHGTYQGFDYEAIAVSYTNRDLISAVDVSAFGGYSDSFVVDSDSRVIINNADNMEEDVFNFIAYLDNSSDIDDNGLEKVRQDLREGNFGITTFHAEGESYYLIYEPVDFQDWMVLGIVPAAVMNASMNQLQQVTMLAVAVLGFLLGVVILILVRRKHRQNIGEKDREILFKEELFNTLSNNVSAVFLMLDADDFKVSYISPNIKRVLGFNKERAQSEIDKEARLFLSGDPACALEHLPSIFLKQRQEWEQEYVNPETGESRSFHITAYREEISGAERYIIVLSDRTDDRKLNAALESALAVAKSANEAKSNFLANMSHDIRNPMNTVVGYAALLERDAENPDKIREYARRITFSSQHLLGLITDVLDMSKIESGQTSLNPEKFSLSEMMEATYTIMGPQAEAKGQTLRMHTNGSVPDSVLGDKTRLNQVLLNILTNAVKYTQEGGEISLTLEALDQRVRNHAHLRFSVADNGFGMSEDFMKIIFDPFTREAAAHRREIQGTGLGMAITKRIVDLMGGTISVESALGQGSTFTVEFELQIAGEKKEEDFWARHGITRLLVADDEEEVCRKIKNLMTEVGVHVDYATSGAEAVETVVAAHRWQEDFHIVILDWKMPGMDGVETARRIRAKIGTDVPILVLTAYDYAEIEEEAKAAGIDMFMSKPFFVSSLQRVIADYYEAEAPETEICPSEELRVLYAEDDEVNAILFQELVSTEGVSCERASNGQEAVKRFEESAPGEFDLVLMDIQMPVMDGYEATRLIRASGHPNAKTVPIVAMTANAFDEDVKKAMEAGMDAHLSKPIVMDRLKAVISKIRENK